MERQTSTIPMISGPERGGDAAVKAAMHPHEPRWFALSATVTAFLALLALLLAIGLGAAAFFSLLVATAGVVVMFRVRAMQRRAILLSNALEVTPTTMPEVDRVIADVRSWMDYRHRLDVYVVNDLEGLVQTSSHLGVHVIAIDADLAADFVADNHPDRLRFFLASAVATLKAGHLRFALPVVLLGSRGLSTYLNPPVLAYRRAASYSADQIAASYGGSLQAGLGTLARLLAGEQLADRVSLGQMLHQAEATRRNVLARYSQLLSPSPDLTRRYVNLLCYAEVAMADQLAAISRELPAAEQKLLKEVLGRSAFRRSDSQPRTIANLVAS